MMLLLLKHLKQIQCDLIKLESASGASQTNNSFHYNNNSGFSKDEKHFDRDKYNYLQFEIQRYTTYVNLLEEKIISESAINTANAIMPSMENPTFVINDNANHHQSIANHQFHQLLPPNGHHHDFNTPPHGSALRNGQLYYNSPSKQTAIGELQPASATPTKKFNYVD